MSESLLSLRAVILRREAGGDDSLLLKTLLENGMFQFFKIPGVLKSVKRSSFHFQPGAFYQIIFRPGQGRVIPKSHELLYSPFGEVQDYVRLSAVAEIIRTADFVAASPDTAEFFSLLESGLKGIPGDRDAVELHIDAFYWRFLAFLGLAAEADDDVEYAAYDLQSGFLTAQEFAARPHTDFVLPYVWVQRAMVDTAAECDAAACRELIRRFLSTI